MVLEAPHNGGGRSSGTGSLSGCQRRPRRGRGANQAGGSTARLPDHLKRLEAESIEIIREVAAAFENPVMLYSIGKDSGVMLHLAAQGLLSVQAALPAAARRHAVEVPGHVHAARRRSSERYGFKLLVYTNEDGVKRGHQPDRLGLLAAHPGDEDRGPEAGARPVRLRRGLRRRAARRGEEPGQGAHLLLPLGRPRLGPAQPAPRAVAPLQHADLEGRDHPGLPAVQLDRARHLGIHLRRGHPDRAALPRRRAAGGASATAC